MMVKKAYFYGLLLTFVCAYGTSPSSPAPVKGFYKNQAELTLKPGNKRTVRVLDFMLPLI